MHVCTYVIQATQYLSKQMLTDTDLYNSIATSCVWCNTDQLLRDFKWLQNLLPMYRY